MSPKVHSPPGCFYRRRNPRMQSNAVHGPQRIGRPSKCVGFPKYLLLLCWCVYIQMVPSSFSDDTHGDELAASLLHYCQYYVPRYHSLLRIISTIIHFSKLLLPLKITSKCITTPDNLLIAYYCTFRRLKHPPSIPSAKTPPHVVSLERKTVISFLHEMPLVRVCPRCS